MGETGEINRLGIALLIGASVMGLSDAVRAQVVVLSAKGPSETSFPVGALLPASQLISLRSGDRLELLDDTGTHQLQGPLVARAGRVDYQVRVKLAQIFLNAPGTKAFAEATRHFPLETVNIGHLWKIDIADGSATCFDSPNDLVFIRDATVASWPTSVLRGRTGQSARVIWAEEPSLTKWPAEIPVRDGETYNLTMRDGSTSTITLRAIVSPAVGLARLAADLVDKKCTNQVDELKIASGSDPSP